MRRAVPETVTVQLGSATEKSSEGIAVAAFSCAPEMFKTHTFRNHACWKDLSCGPVLVRCAGPSPSRSKALTGFIGTNKQVMLKSVAWQMCSGEGGERERYGVFIRFRRHSRSSAQFFGRQVNVWNFAYTLLTIPKKHAKTRNRMCIADLMALGPWTDVLKGGPLHASVQSPFSLFGSFG